MKGKYHSDKTKIKKSKFMKLYWDKISEEDRHDNHYMLGKHHSEETKEKIKKAWSQKDNAIKFINCEICNKKTKSKRFCSNICRYKAMRNGKVEIKFAGFNKGVPHSNEHKEKIHKCNLEKIDVFKENTRLLWKTPEYVKKQMSSRNVKQNKTEKFLEKILKNINNVWTFVGDGQLIVDGKCPDFWDGNNKLIELFGDYWHQGEDPKYRIDLFKSQGYDCLVIWENELKNKSQIINKVIDFMGDTNVKTNNI